MKIFIIVASLITSLSASAGILIEPQLGYVLSNKVSDTMTLKSGAINSSLATDTSTTGVDYGARLGYQFLGLMGGLNYGHISGTNKNNTDGSKSDYKCTNVGVFAGYSAPILLRAWIGYNFSSKVTVAGSEDSGKSTELGLGFTGLPFLSINLIYRMYDIDEVKSAGVTYSATNFKPKEVALAISAPFNLF